MNSEQLATEEVVNFADFLYHKATKAFRRKHYEVAVDLYTSAIEWHPQSSIYYVWRARAYLKLRQPKACLKDCEMALSFWDCTRSVYHVRTKAECQDAIQELTRASRAQELQSDSTDSTTSESTEEQ